LVDVFVLGSINQDFVLKVERRPKPGETVTNAELSTYNGGKGANQAAAALLGASVAFLRSFEADADDLSLAADSRHVLRAEGPIG
jgi:sugar/nucleoside kinase (ribokinase family)